ncbi:MAG: MFS transporter, partial [Planctomycetes bacterium]|nr:MFS transporter [Planctomycetota bacterium]
VNHAVAQTAFNSATWVAHQRLPLPILFVCEDNGIGISVKTPPGWIEAGFSHRPHLVYLQADGSDLPGCWEASFEAVARCRERREPVFLHLRCVRLMGHAGSDVETEYRSSEAIAAAEARDPLLAVARQLADAGVLTPSGILDLYRRTEEEIQHKAKKACTRPKLTEGGAIAAPLKPPASAPVAKEANRPAPEAARVRVFGSCEALPEREGKPLTMAALLSRALADLGAKYPELVVFGEDVADKGGVYHVTADLKKRLGAAHVFDTLLDETTILGLAIGSAQMGLLPLPEIQYLAYLHNAEDQLRGEACSLGYFSNGRMANPMVVRIAALAYQEGFGGHFHNDNAIGVLRDIPGLIVACPARGEDAVGMLRTCVALAKAARKVVVFLEPIALYHQKDLHDKGDGKWLDPYPAPGTSVPFGEGRVYHAEAKDLAILTYGNGVRLSLQAAADLRKRKISARVVDLRWLLPLNAPFVRAQAKACRAVLVVDECRRTGSVSEEIVTLLAEDPGTRAIPVARVTADDTYIPLGDAMKRVIPSREGIVEAAGMLAS